MMSQGVGSSLGVVKTFVMWKFCRSHKPHQNLNEHKQAEKRRGEGGAAQRIPLHSSTIPKTFKFTKCAVEFQFLATVLRICLAMAAGAQLQYKYLKNLCRIMSYCEMPTILISLGSTRNPQKRMIIWGLSMIFGVSCGSVHKEAFRQGYIIQGILSIAGH